MDTATANQNANKYHLGNLISEGKTKKIFGIKDKPGLVMVVSKDDITANNGGMHDILKGKAELANETACNVFRFLATHDIPLAFVEQDNVNAFVARACSMLPYEVVVRRAADGSYLERHPNVSKWTTFRELVVEFSLKTKDKRWKEHELDCDDPILLHGRRDTLCLYDLHKPFHQPFCTLSESEVYTHDGERHLFDPMSRIAMEVFVLLEKEWAKSEGRKLLDYKVEFGIGPDNELLLADVIDSDSWRIRNQDGTYLDKQVYRNGGPLHEVLAKYTLAAEITGRFGQSAD